MDKDLQNELFGSDSDDDDDAPARPPSAPTGEEPVDGEEADGDDVGEGSRNFGHLAYQVEDIYETCQRLVDGGVTINRPPRDGHMAFVRSPDNISIELLQKGGALDPAEPWSSMQNVGEW